MQLSKDQIKFLDRKINYYRGRVEQFTNEVRNEAERIKDADHPDTVARWIKEHAEKLNYNREVLNALELVRGNAEEGNLRFALTRALDYCVRIDDQYFRSSLMEVLKQLMYNELV